MADEPDGPVHYQISVTGRQAAAFFLALLVALGLSFFFGMRTGQASRRAPDPAARLAASSDLSVSAPPSEGTVDEAKARKGPAPTPEAVEKKLGFEDAPPKEVGSPASASRAERAAEATAAPEPRATPPKPTPKAEALKEAPREAAKAPKKEVPRKEPSRKEPAKKEGPAGPVYVQILATKEAEVADQVAKKLKAAGGFVSPDVSTVPAKPGVFRVRIGPYADRSLAEAAVRRLKSEKWKVEPAIVRADKP